MKLELTSKQYRRLLDLVYIGNWVLNATRLEDDRFEDYDKLESIIFSKAIALGMPTLVDKIDGDYYPSQAFEQGGIHEAIADYEGTVFFDTLADELARRDMGDAEITQENKEEYFTRLYAYMEEFEQNGTDNVRVENVEQ